MAQSGINFNPEWPIRVLWSNKKEETTLTKIMGSVVATVEQMTAYIKAKNPDVAQSVIDMISLYLSKCKAEGVRGDIAFAIALLVHSAPISGVIGAGLKSNGTSAADSEKMIYISKYLCHTINKEYHSKENGFLHENFIIGKYFSWLCE